MAATVEVICNQALDLIGYKRHIGDIYDGSLAARIALNAYRETRDEVLIIRPWEFARAYVPMESAGIPSKQPWRYIYIYPPNTVKFLMIKPSNTPPDPQPIRWMEEYDLRVPAPYRTILANLNNAVGVVTFRVVDPASWPADFTETVIEMLAKKFASGFAEARNESRRRGKSSSRDSGEPE